MKKYRLKEKYKPAFQSTYHDAELTHDAWNSNGVTFEALEEVEERIELVLYENSVGAKNVFLSKSTRNNLQFTDQEKELCEKALNRELITLKNARDFIMDMIKREELDWGVKTTRNVTLESQITEYLNEKK